jgi:hypothetical protein
MLENCVRIAGEIAIGEKQQLGEFEQLCLRQIPAPAARRAIAAALCGWRLLPRD